MIPFNKPFLTGKETFYIEEAVRSGKISGNGNYTRLCQDFFEKKYGFRKCLLTTSCTDALEMAAILINCKPGDEIIVPSYTFVSSALAFARQGCNIVFADSRSKNPNIDVNQLTSLITSKTKAIVVVHYAGIAVDMDEVMKIASMHNLFVIEDAAQAIDSFYKGKPLGSIGHLGAFSFHETKNIISGEGGMLTINDNQFCDRAEIIWEKGTNRASFFRGEANKYQWVDTGSSFLPSEIVAAFLWAQLENLDTIQKRRKEIWSYYMNNLKPLADKFELPYIPRYATNNAHLFYLVTKSLNTRTHLLNHLKRNGVHAVFHYLSLHSSPYYLKQNIKKDLPNSDYFNDNLLRLPFFNDISKEEQDKIIELIKDFYDKV